MARRGAAGAGDRGAHVRDHDRRGGAFDQYADTRSQVYGGVSVETAATNQAVAATRGQVVTYQGQPVTTYFFSTSGGKTEDVENTTLGTEPKPWLKSVDDPFDDVSPRHRWTPMTMTLPQAGKKLRGLYRGGFRGIKVLQRGASPRIMRAQVRGTRGSTEVNGATLRQKLGLFDTWAYFTAITGKASRARRARTRRRRASVCSPAPSLRPAAARSRACRRCATGIGPTPARPGSAAAARTAGRS